MTSKLWAYIKKNGLQDKVNRRNINADDKLREVFGGKKTGLDVRDDQAGFQAPEVVGARRRRTPAAAEAKRAGDRRPASFAAPCGAPPPQPMNPRFALANRARFGKIVLTSAAAPNQLASVAAY